MANKILPRTTLTTEHESAMCEIRRQLSQAHSLVSAARTVLLSAEDPDATAVPQQLLDMAEDVLGEHEWINRMDELFPGEQAQP